MFLNLTNHLIATWTGPQQAAARALGLGEPLDLPGGMPQVPAEAEAEVVTAMADALVARARDLGARGAAVFGEPTLTYALVRRLHALGIPCFAATTERRTAETVAGDEVRKVSTFSFVRWRRFDAS